MGPLVLSRDVVHPPRDGDVVGCQRPNAGLGFSACQDHMNVWVFDKWKDVFNKVMGGIHIGGVRHVSGEQENGIVIGLL